MGFIDDFLSVVMKITDAPYLYLKAAAYFCTSFLFGTKVECPDSRVERVNTWFMLSGAPAITRKSTTIGLAVKFCRSMIAQYLKNKFNISDQEAYKTADMMFFETGTTEGISDHLSITCEMPEIDRYALVSAEYGSVLKSASSKDYMADHLTFLSKLYYGESTKVLLSSRGKKKEDERIRYVPEGLYVCTLVGLQDMHLYFDPLAVKQGFMRRFVIIHSSSTDKDRRLPPLDPTVKLARIAFANLVPKYYDMFLKYNETDAILVVFDPDARSIINQVWDSCEKSYMHDPENSYKVYALSMWEHAYKLAILEAISRTPDPPLDASGSRIIEVKADDVRKALQFINKALETVRIPFSMIDAAPKQSSMVIRAGELNYVKQLIYTSDTNGISKSDLLKKSGLTVKQLDELLLTLMQSEQIKCYRYAGKGRGRKGLFFFRPDVTPQGDFEEISPEVFKVLIKT